MWWQSLINYCAQHACAACAFARCPNCRRARQSPLNHKERLMSGKRECEVTIARDNDWNQLVATFPDRTVFHGLPWLQLLCESHGLRRQLLRADMDGRCVGIWPCLDLRKGPFRIVGSPLPGWSTAYLGPLFAPKVDIQVILRAFLESTPLHRWSYFRCRVLDEQRDVDLAGYGFKRLDREETYLLGLSPTESELWNDLKSE